MSVLVEACVTSPREADRALADGAGRLEACRDLDVDGLTPDPELLGAVVARVDGVVPVYAMVRRVPGRHVCAPADRPALLDEVRRCVALGADGIVAGFLEPDGVRPDLDLLARIVEAARPAAVTFHRAFDLVGAPVEAAAALRSVGVDRILTAGGPGRALGNVAALRTLRELHDAGRGPEVIAAGRVRGAHVRGLVEATGVGAVHARASAIAGLVRALGGRAESG